jgi:tetratricopeptide (TPR) repeat protein
MSTEAPSALRADACPDPEVLAAYIDGRLTPGERTTIERHLAGCPECRDLVAGSVEAIDEMARVAVPRPPRTRLWVGLGAVLAAAAAVVMAVRLNQPSPYYVPEMAQLAAVQSDTRAIEPRLSGFRYAAPPSITRGPADAHNLELTATAEKVRAEIGDHDGVNAEAARGVTYLVDGDADRAVDSFERATASASAPPRMLSDLAAAYLQRGRPDDAERALAAAERALGADAHLHEAAFNRALALERLGRTTEAVQAWRDCAAHEPDGQWAAEARRHIDRLTHAG